MASILDRYGIKEVADVTFYNINEDGSLGNPVLFLDTLKVSTIEQTASSSDARGGKGNAKLISWDFDKEISVTLEDALFSPKSLSIMYGQSGDVVTEVKTITKTMNFVVTEDHNAFPGVTRDGNDRFVFVSPKIGGQANPAASVSDSDIKNIKWYDEAGNPVTTVEGTDPSGDKGQFAGARYMCTFEVPVKASKTIAVDAAHFPGTYYIVGDTYARNDATGKDEFFQFVIYKAKVSPENTITLQADGDPSTFSMNLTVLRNPEGKMMDLIQYTLTEKPKA